MADKQLEPRLATIVAILEALACYRVHDLACDHGLVSAAYASAFPLSEVFASDIASKPLARAKDLLLSKLKLNNVHCLLSDGLSKHEKVEAGDSVVLAGLSGETLWQIICNDKRLAALDYKDRVPLFIVAQPMQLAAKFKLAAYLHDFSILHESLVLDKGRVQEVILLQNYPYQALQIKQAQTDRLLKLAKNCGQAMLLADRDKVKQLALWQQTCKAKIGLNSNWRSDDVQVILTEITKLYNQASQIEQKADYWQYLLALINCGLTALLTVGEANLPLEFPKWVNYPALCGDKTLNLAGPKVSAKAEYLDVLLKYYKHKLAYLYTKVEHVPSEEKALWQAFLHCLNC